MKAIKASACIPNARRTVTHGGGQGDVRGACSLSRGLSDGDAHTGRPERHGRARDRGRTAVRACAPRRGCGGMAAWAARPARAVRVCHQAASPGGAHVRRRAAVPGAFNSPDLGGRRAPAPLAFPSIGGDRSERGPVNRSTMRFALCCDTYRRQTRGKFGRWERVSFTFTAVKKLRRNQRTCSVWPVGTYTY